ncbi:MTH1187 family thiamine-binding protein [Sulfobacillus thermosulfidooxidans]|uniref:MTH1187 family thiamine-binding protein n=1 Tax=Sulfobacillus thermosulfidooxidans TaxID=28034 RepID=UPI00096B78E1|nr:MTH1187 family thiamine-binding protein [Sulfobacillus thermosulfidooxidans]OLZ11790.1 hypothetical protein BFX05_07325 [Sulfobacillus thermosulfidooxidans]OLZ17072.1 hypothetical protein BFX06_14150 [Sulfobacillus thermosulfidooxidans]OLZ20168.1 hypothetical protein BFX07_00880 [Sulfobacillus thermosulfidooxidans]
MAIAEIKVWPVGTDDASVSSYIRQCFRVAENNEDVEAVLTPTSTILEGPIPSIMSVARAMHDAPFDLGCERVVTTITIDERQDREEHMEDMVDSVINNLEA